MSTVEDLLAQAQQHHASGNLPQAEHLYRTALQHAPTSPDAWLRLGNLYFDQHRLPEAEQALLKSIQLRPNDFTAHNYLGIVQERQSRLADAATSFRKAVELNPQYPLGHYHLGFALQQLGHTEEAIECYRSALAINPDFAMAYNNLGSALKTQGHIDEAIACFRRTIELKPDFATAYNNLGIALQAQRKMDEALACYLRAVELNPGSHIAHNNLGEFHRRQGRLDEALTYFQQAIELSPDYSTPHLNRSLIWLLQGDFERGWKEYEWRWPTNHPPRHFEQPEWDGTPLPTGTILIHAEQGLGDTLQFIRYASLVKQLVGTVIVECQPPLLPLLRSCAGIDQLVSTGDELPPFDVHVSMLSLPRVLATTVESVPRNAPYLFADPALVTHWDTQLASDTSFRVGIAWQGNPTNPSHQRSIPLENFAELAVVKGVTFYSLQKTHGLEQLDAVRDKFAVTEFGAFMDEANGAFMDTAAVMKNLDLVITADTSIPHLAGGLGVPVWLALPTICDWRWLLDRDDSPWYPTMRLFRQKELGDWNDVFLRIAEELDNVVSQRQSII